MRANVENEAFFLKLVEDGALVIRDDGTVFNGKTLKVYDRVGNHGHIGIAFKVRGKMKHILVSRLVYLAKIGPAGPTEKVYHLDGVKTHNMPSNLAKGDNSDSMKHAYAINEWYRTKQANITAGRLRTATGQWMSKQSDLNQNS